MVFLKLVGYMHMLGCLLHSARPGAADRGAMLGNTLSTSTGAASPSLAAGLQWSARFGARDAVRKAKPRAGCGGLRAA